jgi:hypothetical protein
MSKILVNTVSGSVSIADMGVSVSGFEQYTISPVNYPDWARSSDVVVQIGNGTLVVNDGSTNLSISDGVDLIKGIFPKTIVISNFSNTTIDFPHYMIHRGRSFSIEHVYTLQNGDVHDHAIVTPATGTRYAHVIMILNASGDTELMLYESPSLNLGSEISATKRNRNGANSNTTKIYNFSNLTSVGTRICWQRYGQGTSGEHGSNSPIVSSESAEYILKANTTYLYRVFSNSNSNIIFTGLHWYEYDYVVDV